MRGVPPIPNSPVPAGHLISLCYNLQDGINWSKGDRATLDQLKQAIYRASGQRLPKRQIMGPLCPGEVVLLEEGVFEIRPEWDVQPFPVSRLSEIHVAPDHLKYLKQVGIVT